MKAYEVTAAGWRGDTDETDDRALWIVSESFDQVEDVIKGTGAKLWGEVDFWDDRDIDYTLPEQQERVIDRLRQFQSNK